MLQLSKVCGIEFVGSANLAIMQVREKRLGFKKTVECLEILGYPDTDIFNNETAWNLIFTDYLLKYLVWEYSNSLYHNWNSDFSKQEAIKRATIHASHAAKLRVELWGNLPKLEDKPIKVEIKSTKTKKYGWGEKWPAVKLHYKSAVKSGKSRIEIIEELMKEFEVSRITATVYYYDAVKDSQNT